MKIIIVSFLISLIVLFIYWVGGNEFVRSSGMAIAVVIQIVVFIVMLTFPGYPKSWRGK